jgi:hypothetical protein
MFLLGPKALTRIGKPEALAATHNQGGPIVPVLANDSGVTDNRPALQAAIDLSSATGREVHIPAADPGSYYGYSYCLYARDDATIIVPDETELWCMGNHPTKTGWPYYGSILYGTYNALNPARAPDYAISDVTLDDTGITFTTPSDADDFVVGDIVNIERTDTFAITIASGTYYVPVWGQLNVVTGKGVGTLTLQHPIQASKSGMIIRRLTNTGTTWLKSNGDDTGEPMFAVNNFTLIGGTWKTVQADAPFQCDGGIVNSLIAPYVTDASKSAAYGNLIGYTTITTTTANTRKGAIELAYNSCDVDVAIGSIVGTTTGAPKAMVWVNEMSRLVDISVTSLAAGTQQPENLCSVVLAQDNTIAIGTATISGDIGAVGIPGALICVKGNSGFTYTGEVPDVTGNDITIPSITFTGACDYFVRFDESNTTANTVHDSTATGTLTGNAVAYISEDGATGNTLDTLSIDNGTYSGLRGDILTSITPSPISAPSWVIRDENADPATSDWDFVNDRYYYNATEYASLATFQSAIGGAGTLSQGANGITVTDAASALISSPDSLPWAGYISTAFSAIIEAETTAFASSKTLMTVGDGSANNRIHIYVRTDRRMGTDVKSGGAVQANIYPSTVVSASPSVNKYAIALEEDSAGSCVNGGAPTGDTSMLMPVGVTTSFLGVVGSTGLLPMNDAIGRFTAFDRRLSNADLQYLTT